jgi:hypothetical protein
MADMPGRCPFHYDEIPSLVVSPKTNLWHCLGWGRLDEAGFDGRFDRRDRRTIENPGGNGIIIHRS